MKFKIASLLVSAFIVFSSQVNAEVNNQVKKGDIKYLENRVLYSQKPVAKSTWYDYKRGLFLANEENKYILMSFCPEDNIYCNKLEQKTYKDPKIKSMLEQKFITIKVDPKSDNRITANKNFLEKDLVKQYEVEGYPTITFLSPQGKVVSGAIQGFVDADKLAVILKYISTEAYKNTTLKEFERKEKIKS